MTPGLRMHNGRMRNTASRLARKCLDEERLSVGRGKNIEEMKRRHPIVVRRSGGWLRSFLASPEVRGEVGHPEAPSCVCAPRRPTLTWKHRENAGPSQRSSVAAV